jgi:GDP-D-mannose dehydratase
LTLVITTHEIGSLLGDPTKAKKARLEFADGYTFEQMVQN